ncbi:hypothetical protein A2767_01260 [Candidatus Roizmanbacteria bacterium RIFCSPHIGHO2_01_FULL_35_10]|uniref:Uncharacterized protein n=1 Tax=Candidatus Roizmanbacteria bacterium RIFCSPLOWO2_01_FULL_35_13 TaxID=1802055 RepID=A0A1F7I7P7_9BACT|nr:MAG: hypothetical protein A2767_01260 [Candidatus Roizmanbacteria bacterium RIFCSPHIGHO2_01_FULL_35_10]OGK39391.1 MAG: hypothetical protein A3A74_06165 [Candidatus Roizmanbacteria bacterium RIFCSPLOWO2_01_FULL_35_13]
MKLNHIFTFIIVFFLSLILFQLFFKHLTIQTYCNKQTAFKLYKFRQSVKKNSADEKIEVNHEVNKFLTNLYNECLNN